MTESWGIPEWLPPGVRRRAALDAAAEAREERAAQAERERAIEARREKAVADYVADASMRGEALDVGALAAGRVPRRTVAEVLAAAVAAGDADDRRVAAQLHRDGHGEPEKIHVMFDEPVLHGATRSATGWKIFNQARHFRDKLEARRALEQAERAAEQSQHDYGLVCERRERS